MQTEFRQVNLKSNHNSDFSYFTQKNSEDENFLVFNPDTIWTKSYIEEINEMINMQNNRFLDTFKYVDDRSVENFT